MSEWIPVAERLPVPLTDVLVSYRNLEGDLAVDAGFLRPAGSFHYLGMDLVQINNVVAWMDFPAPPSEEIEG